MKNRFGIFVVAALFIVGCNKEALVAPWNADGQGGGNGSGGGDSDTIAPGGDTDTLGLGCAHHDSIPHHGGGHDSTFVDPDSTDVGDGDGPPNDTTDVDGNDGPDADSTDVDGDGQGHHGH